MSPQPIIPTKKATGRNGKGKAASTARPRETGDDSHPLLLAKYGPRKTGNAKTTPEMRIPKSPRRDGTRIPKDRLQRIAAITVNAPQSNANLTVDFNGRSSMPATFLPCKFVATPIYHQYLLFEDFALRS